MAKVPTGLEAGLGQVQPTAAATPPQSDFTTPEAFGGGAANKAKLAGEVVSSLGAQLTDATVRYNNRKDTINRTREFNAFFKNASTRYQEMSQTEDMTDAETLKKFNKYVDDEFENTMKAHGGSSDSRARLELRMLNESERFKAQAVTAVNAAQEAVVDEQFGSDISRVAAGVASGEVTLEAGLNQIEGIADELGPAYSQKKMFDKVEAAQELVIVNATQRLVDLGQVDKAEDLINGNPEVFQTLDAKTVSNMVRSHPAPSQASRAPSPSSLAPHLAPSPP